MARALALAPSARVVPPRFEAYATASEKVFKILKSVTPLVEPLSLDEAFLDVTASIALFGPPARIATLLRNQIAEQLSLPASAGIAPSKFVAKIASDLAKPKGQCEVNPEDVIAFLRPLPVTRLWGVGPKTEALLLKRGLRTLADIAEQGAETLERHLGANGRHLWELSQGLDDREVIPDRLSKSIGSEDTFDEDLEKGPALLEHLHLQAWRVARRLRNAGIKAKTVQLKLKFSDFTRVNRSKTLDQPSDDGQAFYRIVVALLPTIPEGKRIRLCGVSSQNLSDGAEEQLSLFSAPEKSNERLNQAIDAIQEKFGVGALTTADVHDLSESE